MVMRWMILIVCSLAVVGGRPSESSGRDPATLEGAWEVVERSFVRGDSSWAVPDPQPGIYLFTGTWYGVQEIRESRKRADFEASTDDLDRLAAFDVFHAHAGTYQVVDDRLLVTPSIAKSPNTMNGSTYEYTLRWIEEDILIVRTAPNEVRSTRLRRIE